MEQKPISLESEAGFRVLFECATISILVINDRGGIELSNPCAETLFGYKPAELIGKPIEVLIPEALRHKHTHHREGYFQRPKFFRAKNTGNIQGTGLGLTVVKRYVELMGGDVSFVSKLFEGTTFPITLPKSTGP